MEKQTSSGGSAAETGTQVDDGRDTWLPSRRGVLKLTGGGLGAMVTGGTLLGSASAATTGGNCVQVDFVTGTSPIDDLSSAKYVDGDRLIEAQWAETVNNDTEGQETTRTPSSNCTVAADSSVSIDFSNNTASVTYTVENCSNSSQDLMLVSYESPCNNAAGTGGKWDSSNADQQEKFDTDTAAGLGNTSGTLTVDVPPLTAGAPQRSNAEAYLSFDQSSLPATNELDGTDTTTKGDPTTEASGQAGTAFDFDGVGDYLTYPNLDMSYDSGDWTTSMWINPDSIPSGEDYFLWHPRGHINLWLPIDHGNYFESGELYLGTWDGSTVRRMGSGVTPATGEWTHIAVVSDTSADEQHQIYVDGTKEASSNMGDPEDSSEANAIGGHALDPKNYFNGQIDEMYAYSTALSDSEVNSLYTTAT